MLQVEETTGTVSQILVEKSHSRSARVGIVGLGYVGLPLAGEFAKAGFSVTGIDVNLEKARRVNAGDFGFMPFYPGPALGGHCIPIDPFYLAWKTKQAGIKARFIELAGYINGKEIVSEKIVRL